MYSNTGLQYFIANASTETVCGVGRMTIYAIIMLKLIRFKNFVPQSAKHWGGELPNTLLRHYFTTLLLFFG